MGVNITVLLIVFSLALQSYAAHRFFPDRNKLLENQYEYSNFFGRSLLESNLNSQNNVPGNNNTFLVTMKLRGDTELGYYYVTLFFGSPIQKQTLIVDTGSVTTTIPCKECGNNCGKSHFNLPFDHSQSSTFKDFECMEEFGKYTCSDCTGECYFSVAYVEGSSYNGHFKKDVVVFGNEIEEYYDLLHSQKGIQAPQTVDKDESADTTRSTKQSQLEQIYEQRKLFMPFGCTYRETKLFFTQEADGILGLGVGTNTRSSPPNLLDIIEMNNNKNSKAFSLCLAQEGGYFTAGGYNFAYHEKEDKVQYVPYYDEFSQYRVYVKKIEIEGDDIALTPKELNHGEGAFFDSGTTLTHFPEKTFNTLKSQIYNFCNDKTKTNCGGNYGVSSNGLCFTWAVSRYNTLEEFQETFPSFTFYFGQDGEAPYQWKPQDYLYKKEGKDQQYCIGISRFDRETILGGTFMKNHDVLFDKTNKRLGLVRANCEAVNNVANPEVIDSSGKTVTPTIEEGKDGTGTDSGKTPIDEQTPKDDNPTKTGTETGTGVTTIESKSDSSGTKTVVILICIGAIVGLIGYYFFKSVKKNKYSDMVNDIEIPESAGKVNKNSNESNPDHHNTENLGKASDEEVQNDSLEFGI